MTRAFGVTPKEGLLKTHIARGFCAALLICGNTLALASTVVLPETGQTTCHDTTGSAIPCNSTGHDADWLAGAAWPNPRFTNNGNGTITDNLTGLVWLQNALCFSSVTWLQALNDANTLNSGECGLTDGSAEGDWRLPNINELESLVNAGQISTAAWLNSQGFINVLQLQYWSSTNWVVLPNLAWTVLMYGGHMGPIAHATGRLVLPVRAATTPPAELWETGQTSCYEYFTGNVIACSGTGQDGDWQAGVSWPSPRFTNNNNGTATDNLTGLIWLLDADCFGAQAWADALNSANTLNSGECGLSDGSQEGDWRLPNRKESRSLSDYSQSFPTLPAGHPFLNVQTSEFSDYWTATTYAANTDQAFLVDYWTAGGTVNADFKANSHYVWPVRAGVEQHVTLTINGSGNGSGGVTAPGINCVISGGTASGDCTEVYDSGTAVGLTPLAAGGSSFGGWTGPADCIDGAVTMDASMTCTASFVAAAGGPLPLPLPVGPIAIPGGGGCIPLGSQVPNNNPLFARPLGELFSGNNFFLTLYLSPVAGLVDLYLVVQLSNGQSIILGNQKQWLPYPANQTPFLTNTQGPVAMTDVFNNLFGAPFANISPGTYIGHLLMVPAGVGLGSPVHYDWCFTKTF